MKIVDTNSGTQVAPFRVRVNRTGRRTYSREYKLEIVEGCSVPGASVAGVALSHRTNANLVRRWMVQHRAGRLIARPTMLPVRLSRPGGRSLMTDSQMVGEIEIEFPRAVIRVRGAVDGAALKSVLEALVKA